MAISQAGCIDYYQVVDTASSNTVLSKVNGQEYFVYENDTLKITYSFWASRGVMSFKIFNKLNMPIYIDWRKSSFINDSDKINYWDDDITRTSTARYEGSSIYHRYAYRGPYLSGLIGVTRTSGQVESKKERVTFIPPKSNYFRSSFHLLNDIHYVINKTDNVKVVPRSDNPKRTTKVYAMTFTRETTPFLFRNFITYSTTEAFSNEYYVDNEFYVKSIVEMRDKHFSGKTIQSTEDYILYDTPFLKSSSFYLYIPNEQANLNPELDYNKP